MTEAAEVAREHRAEDLLAFATSAIREAGNGAAVLDRVRAETGVHLQELGGEAEASATFLAVRRWFGWGAGSILDLDIGGGSFELSMGVDEVPELAVSVPLGQGRVTRDLLVGDPASATSVKAARRHAREVLAEPVRGFLALGRPDLVAGTSKTFRSLARITGAARAPPVRWCAASCTWSTSGCGPPASPRSARPIAQRCPASPLCGLRSCSRALSSRRRPWTPSASRRW